MIRRVKNLYVLSDEYSYSHPALKGISYSNAWCSISNGAINIYKGYAHDGCTPKYEVGGLFVIGIPDGRLHLGRPITYHASLVHDALCQFRRYIPITKAATVQIFNDMLAEVRYMPRPLYVAMVDKFGPQRFGGDKQQ